MSREKESKKLNATVSVTFFTVFLIGIGILLFAASFIDLESSKYDILKKLAAPYESVTRNIGLTCLSAGLVSVLVEVSTITNVVKSAVIRIVAGDFPFDNFSIERLNELNKQIVVKRCETEKMTVQNLSNSVYALEDELLSASKGLYYDYNKATFIVEHDSKSKVFKKRVEFDYRVINKYSLENKVSINISIIHPSDSLTQDELKEKFHIKKFVLHGGDKNNSQDIEEDLSKEANDYVKINSIEGQAHSLYKYEVSFEYPLSKCLWNKVELMYEYEIPDYDIVQSYKLNYPSKVLEHTIIIKPDKSENEYFELAGDAYTAFYFPPTDKEYQVIQDIPDNIRISFRDWSITGAGYMVTFLKK